MVFFSHSLCCLFFFLIPLVCQSYLSILDGDRNVKKTTEFLLDYLPSRGDTKEDSTLQTKLLGINLPAPQVARTILESDEIHIEQHDYLSSPEPSRVQVHFSRLRRKFYNFTNKMRNLYSYRVYGIISSVNRKNKQSKVDWHHRGNKESGSDYPHYRLLRIVNCQTLGDEPLHSLFNRTYNENGNNITNPNNYDTSNSNKNSNGKENGFELIINRGVINTLQSQLSKLYNITWQYIVKAPFKSKISSINPSVSDITITTCYQMYEKNDITKLFNQLYGNTTKMNERALSIARQIKEKTIKIPSSLGHNI